MRRLVIDSQIPQIRGVFEPYFQCTYIKGNEISAADLSGAVGLLVRTRTVCNKALLDGSDISAIATATIGLDHIDADFCKSAGIAVYSAQGCNARAVAQWVLSTIGVLGGEGLVPADYTLGIVGVGNVGSEVLGMAGEIADTSPTITPSKILLCDPPRAQRGDSGLCTLPELLQNSNIVTIHTPLDHTTAGMVDSEFLRQMKPGAILLNSARGEIIDTTATLQNNNIHYCFDVWSGEPNIDQRVLRRTTIATPHIAGYSARGKARATMMIVQQIAQHFGIKELMQWDCAATLAPEKPLACDIQRYDTALRQNPNGFEAQRTIRP